MREVLQLKLVCEQCDTETIIETLPWPVKIAGFGKGNNEVTLQCQKCSGSRYEAYLVKALVPE